MDVRVQIYVVRWSSEGPPTVDGSSASILCVLVKVVGSRQQSSFQDEGLRFRWTTSRARSDTSSTYWSEPVIGRTARGLRKAKWAQSVSLLVRGTILSTWAGQGFSLSSFMSLTMLCLRTRACCLRDPKPSAARGTTHIHRPAGSTVLPKSHTNMQLLTLRQFARQHSFGLNFTLWRCFEVILLTINRCHMLEFSALHHLPPKLLRKSRALLV